MQVDSVPFAKRATAKSWSARAYTLVACTAAVVSAGQVVGSAPAARPATSPAPVDPSVQRPAGFVHAIRLLCGGRHADAYGRLVSLADDGDVGSGRVALVLHRLGPTLFGSEWDASPEQLETWHRWSGHADDAPVASTSAARQAIDDLCGCVEVPAAMSNRRAELDCLSGHLALASASVPR